jgi:hypothetical protein
MAERRGKVGYRSIYICMGSWKNGNEKRLSYLSCRYVAMHLLLVIERRSSECFPI